MVASLVTMLMIVSGIVATVLEAVVNFVLAKSIVVVTSNNVSTSRDDIDGIIRIRSLP